MCYNIQLTLTIGFLLLTTCQRAKGVSPTMQKIAAFIVKKRKLLLVVMLALAVVCAALMPFVGINTDMTKYLPDSSQMKIGMDRMNEAFPDVMETYTIRVMFRGLDARDKLAIREQLAEIPNVDSVAYEPDSDDYNRGDATLYKLTTQYDYKSDEEAQIERDVADRFDGYDVAVRSDDTSTPDIPPIVFILSIVLCVVVFRGGTPVTAPDDSLSFGAAVELAVAMPLSWLPLISDYTREAEKPFAATLSSTLTYGVVSCWMYVIGMGAAIFTGEGDIALIMVKAGLGVAALLILILSTVTTTFLDAYSAGISAESLSKKINGKYAALIVTVIGTVCAICFPMDDITNFLYLIGSVFAPMIAIQITDFFLLRRGGASGRLDVCNAVVWVLGFGLYRVLMTVDIPVGNTLPDMAGTMLLCLIAHKIVPDKTRAS